MLAQAQQEARMLDMINKIQMFQIAGDKVNSSLIHRKKNPVFNLSTVKKSPPFRDQAFVQAQNVQVFE